jgi:hypothetical protein
MPTPTQLATPNLLTAGQARAQRLIDAAEKSGNEVGELRKALRNECALAAWFANDDGTINVQFNGRPYGVMLTPDGDFDYAQIAGIDVTDLLPLRARQDMTTLALNARRQQRIADAWDARQDALAQEQAA